MSKGEYARRYLVLAVGLTFAAFGVVIIIKSNTGNAPASGLTYVLTQIVPSISLGIFTVLYNATLMLAQILLLRKDYQLVQLLQLPMSFFLGAVTDLAMSLLDFIKPSSYPLQILALFIGCVFLGIGAATQVRANVLMNSGEALINAIAIKTGKNFGNIKVIFDSCLVLTTVILSLVFLKRIVGVREGTLISALLIGNVAKVIIPRLDWQENWMKGGRNENEQNL